MKRKVSVLQIPFIMFHVSPSSEDIDQAHRGDEEADDAVDGEEGEGDLGEVVRFHERVFDDEQRDRYGRADEGEGGEHRGDEADGDEGGGAARVSEAGDPEGLLDAEFGGDGVDAGGAVGIVILTGVEYVEA